MAEIITDKWAIEVMGEDKVISATTVVEGWNRIIAEKRYSNRFQPMEVPKEIELKYSTETLESFLENPEWFLVYNTGVSLKSILVFLGSNSNREPCQYAGNDWWIEHCWSDESDKANYYLLKITGDCKNMEWKKQKQEIADMGEKLQRPPTCLMINLGIAYFLFKGVYLQETCYHWGPELELHSGRVRCASRFDKKGFALFNWHELCPRKNLGTFVIRKFDF